MADDPEITANLLAMYGRDDWIMRRNFRLFLRVSGLAAMSRESRLLDLGCAMGHLMRQLAEAGFTRVTGLDASPEMAEAARRITGQPVVASPAEACGDLFPAGSMDGVIVSDLLHHITEVAGWDALLAGCGRVLAPGGVLVIREPWPTRTIRLLAFLARFPFLHVGFMAPRLRSFIQEEALLAHFYAHWVPHYRQSLARHGFEVVVDHLTPLHRIVTCRHRGG